jgi:hypothetical protein
MSRNRFKGSMHISTSLRNLHNAYLCPMESAGSRPARDL